MKEHKTFPYPVDHFSHECMNDGVGCDGTCECGTECNCKCHSDWAPDFITNEDVKEWHDA